jgi:hypothetical protein
VSQHKISVFCITYGDGARRNKNSSIKIDDKLFLLSYDREISVSRRRQKDIACRVSEDNGRNYQSAVPESKEIWTLEEDFEASSGIKMPIVEDKEKCTSKNKKHHSNSAHKVTVFDMKNRYSTSGSEGIYLDVTSYTALPESHPVGVPYPLTSEGSIIELGVK